MKTGSIFLDDLKENGLSFRYLFRYPYVYVAVTDPAFGEYDDREDREAYLTERIGWNAAELRRTMHQANFQLQMLTAEELEQEYGHDRHRGHSWLRSILAQAHPPAPQPVETQESPIRVVHFHGYKGGQARSSCLAFLGRVLADSGWNVLVVDADIEAPSLDILFNTKPLHRDSTLLGVSQGAEPAPERVYTSPLTQGNVDLLAYRPASEEYDIEAVALAMRAAMDPLIIEQNAGRIADFARNAEYHLILIDHRAGLSPYNLPWLHRLPGPVVIFARLDEQWSAAKSYLPVLLHAYPSMPGLFVSFKTDSERIEQYLARNQAQIEQLLQLLVDAKLDMQPATEEEEEEEGIDLTPMDLRDHFLVWPYDAAFRSVRVPDPERTSGDLRAVISELRRLLGLEQSQRRPDAPRHLHPSGAQDEGAFIQTSALRQIQSTSSSIRYIFGRKGTGKTRLLREMAARGLGEPLLVDPNDTGETGLRSRSTAMEKATETFRENPQGLWWLLFGCALEQRDTATTTLEKSLERALEAPPSISQLVDQVRTRAQQQPRRRIFLLDGLELAFNARQIFPFMEGLFHVLLTIQTDPRLSERMDFRLFLRADLAEIGIQNIEQQIHGQVIYLRWDIQTIFNFVLSRIQSRDWYRTHFHATVEKIDQREHEILNGLLDIPACEELLLEIFPPRIPRHNLQTTTFLRTYFTDSASTSGPPGSDDTDGERATFYPRVYDRFVEVIARPNEGSPSKHYSEEQRKGDRINPSLLVFAHEAAAQDYLGQVRQELYYLIQLDQEFDQNRRRIDRLLDAFAGESSPFKPDRLASNLAGKSGLGEPDVRAAMNKMKAIGMFEDRPKHAEDWRVGRLFKSSLRMKYAR